jgi:hypothetical protein
MRIAILMFSISMLCMAIPLAGEGQSKTCTADLSLRLRTIENSVVAKDGALLLDVEVRNEGNAPHYIYGDLGPGVWLHIYNASGVEVQPKVLFEHTPPPPKASDFLRLLPGHSLTLHDRYPSSQLGLLPGRYTARIDFMLVPAIDALGFHACSGWLHTKDAISFEVIK